MLPKMQLLLVVGLGGSKSLLRFPFFVYFIASVHACMHVIACMWGSENSFGDLVLSFSRVCFRDQSQVIRLDSRCLSLLSHLPGDVSIAAQRTAALGRVKLKANSELWEEKG